MQNLFINSKSSMLSDKIKNKIHSADQKLNVLVGYNANNIENNFNTLFKYGYVEVGYRSSCGSTHPTMKTYREFYKILKILIKEGLEVSEENVTHGNAYATNNGGFWNSTIFKLIK